MPCHLGLFNMGAVFPADSLQQWGEDAKDLSTQFEALRCVCRFDNFCQIRATACECGFMLAHLPDKHGGITDVLNATMLW